MKDRKKFKKITHEMKKKYTRVRRVANKVQRGGAGLSANSLNEF